MRNWKYLFVFLITCGIFGTAWYLSTYVNQQKIDEIRDIQNKVAIDILSSETQFSLLEEMSCQDLNNSVLTEEISSLASKISYSEQNVGAKEEILMLKKQYTILQVKDFLLSKRIGERCNKPPVSILYFYGNRDNCNDCVKQGYVLDALHEKYPELRIYSFDYNLDLSTIRALKTIYKINDTLPALVIGEKTLSGFKTVEEITALLPKDFINPPVKPATTTTQKKTP
jgi:hypothetical protein